MKNNARKSKLDMIEYTENESLKHNEWVKETKAQFFDLRKKYCQKKGVKYKKI